VFAWKLRAGVGVVEADLVRVHVGNAVLDANMG
jgi:hypothetical protein